MSEQSTHGAEPEWIAKSEWIAEVRAMLAEHRSGVWHMRTDTGHEIMITVAGGELVHARCGFLDEQGIMATIARATLLTYRRDTIDTDASAAKALIARETFKELLTQAEEGKRVEQRPSRRLAYGATHTEALRPGQGRQRARDAAPAPAHPPAPARAAAPAPARATGRASTAQAPPPARPIPWIRRTVIIGAALAAVALALDTGLGEYLPPALRALAMPHVHTSPGRIRADTVWRAGHTVYVTGNTRVEGDAMLTIEAGVEVRMGNRATLTVERDARLRVHGTHDAPVVMTSNRPRGDRAAGDWGGLVLRGNAPLGTAGAEGTEREYGGSNANGECASGSHLRIEFAGADNAPRALALEGCGSATRLSHIQIHRSTGTALEVRGGATRLARIALTQTDGHGIRLGDGWSGTLQQALVQLSLEGSGTAMALDGVGTAATPARVFNVTIVGSNPREGVQRGLGLANGARARIANLLIAGLESRSIWLDDTASAAALREARIDMTHVLSAAAGLRRTAVSGSNPVVETLQAWAEQADRHVTASTRAMLDDQAWFSVDPHFAPGAGGPAEAGTALPADLDKRTHYLGAVRPGARTTWLWSWTRYPED